MPPGRDRESTREILRLKVGDKKDDRPTGHDLIEVIKGRRRVGPAPHRIKEEDFANDSQGMRAPFLRRDEKLEAIAEEKETDFVVVTDRAESEETGNFCSQLAF